MASSSITNSSFKGDSAFKCAATFNARQYPDSTRSLMAGALNAPVATMKNAGKGGAWGIALLAAYQSNNLKNQSLDK
jgi:hypothetical protein